jgi:hypothetical protein
MSDQLTEIFWEIHNGLPRAGPGDNDSTRRAYLMLKDLPENPRIKVRSMLWIIISLF